MSTGNKNNNNKVKNSETELKDRLVSIQRVTKVTKGGRGFTFSAVVVVGDEKGVVGYGLGKAKEVTDAVFLKPAAPGTGVIAGGAMRAVLESVGVHDVLAKSKGSSNPHNVVKATVIALSQMRDAVTVAQHRGISLSRVFNG
jgi:small subunit ribosomal protein S5